MSPLSLLSGRQRDLVELVRSVIRLGWTMAISESNPIPNAGEGDSLRRRKKRKNAIEKVVVG